MQELAPTSPRVGLVLQYLQERPTPHTMGKNDSKDNQPSYTLSPLGTVLLLPPLLPALPCVALSCSTTSTQPHWHFQPKEVPTTDISGDYERALTAEIVWRG